MNGTEMNIKPKSEAPTNCMPPRRFHATASIVANITMPKGNIAAFAR